MAAPVTLQAQTPRFVIEGADPQLTANIRAHVRVPDLPCDATGYRLARTLPAIRQAIVRAGRALGYYELSHVTRIDRESDCWVLLSDIDPGRPVLVGDIQIELLGERNLFEDLLSDLPLQSGQQLNQSSFEQIKNDLSAQAIANGFFDAQFERSALRLDLIENRADIDIAFDPGTRFRFGSIEIQQLDALSPEFINRFLAIEPGDPYSSQALLELRNSLNGSLYFSSVSVSPAINEAQAGSVPVRVGLQMRPRRVYGAGVGVSTDIGPRVRFDYENRYLNRRGHTVQGNAGISPIRQNLDLGYTLPMRNPATERLEISTGFLAEDTASFTNQTTKLATTYSFINGSGWRQKNFISFQHDNSEIADAQIETDLVIAGVSLDRTRADDALYPTRGWRLFGELKGASDQLLSSDSFLQLNLSGKLIRTLGPGRVLVRFNTGTSWIEETAELPVSVLYFSGGDQSVRGYRYESLGPQNEDGIVIGGTHVISAGIEYDFSVAQDWKLAVFADTGNAFEDFSNMELKSGVGVGVRWLSPVGPIRVDLATALDLDNELRLHITMGPDL